MPSGGGQCSYGFAVSSSEPHTGHAIIPKYCSKAGATEIGTFRKGAMSGA